MVALNQGGSIINMSSCAGLNRTHEKGAVAYISSKAAFNTMTKVMAMELGKHKIRLDTPYQLYHFIHLFELTLVVRTICYVCNQNKDDTCAN
uniref:Uncharacterized protein n=1 Tax=Lactuca sativa TaxID=4236 RepID=A0A9R1XBW7_LACSA|nr:hypothetical protein LSAT_V11C500286240 [Lactuca sativa]